MQTQVQVCSSYKRIELCERLSGCLTGSGQACVWKVPHNYVMESRVYWVRKSEVETPTFHTLPWSLPWQKTCPLSVRCRDSCTLASIARDAFVERLGSRASPQMGECPVPFTGFKAVIPCASLPHAFSLSFMRPIHPPIFITSRL
jgi:hypothetical protein